VTATMSLADELLRLTDSQPAPTIVSVCGWCPDAREQTARFTAQGRLVSHGMCPVCVAKMEAEFETK
jgi:hypothetical protein